MYNDGQNICSQDMTILAVSGEFWDKMQTMLLDNGGKTIFVRWQTIQPDNVLMFVRSRDCEWEAWTLTEGDSKQFKGMAQVVLLLLTKYERTQIKKEF